MNFEYHVSNLYEAQKSMQERWASHIVSALGRADAIPSMGDHHLVMTFDDTEVVDDTGKWVAMTRADMERVFEFTSTLGEGDRLLVHCRAGKSRSTAILMGVLMQHGMTADEAFTAVLTIRPVAIPNRLIVEHIDDILDTGGALTNRVAAYYRTLMIPGIHLPDRGGANL